MPNLPGVGKVPKGWLIAVGVGSVAAIAYYAWRRKSAGSSSSGTGAAAAGTAGDPYPPDGTQGNPSDPNSTDPDTGMTYGDESLYGGGAGGYGTSGFGFPGATGGTFSTGSTGTGDGTGGPPFTSNAAWATYCETQLGGVVDPTALSAALGVYLTGRPATADQTSLIDQAVAIGGWPPVAGTGGYPPNVRQQPGGPGTGGGGTGGGGQVTVPNVVGGTAAAAARAIDAAGLTRAANLSSDPAPHGTSRIVYAQEPHGGAHAKKGTYVHVHWHDQRSK